MPHTPYSCTHKPRTHLGATSTQVIDHTYRSKRSATSPQRQQQHSDCARPCPTRAAPTALDSHLHCHASSMLRSRLHTSPRSARQTHRRSARWRAPLRPPRCPSVPHTHCRELCRSSRLLRFAAVPWPLPTALPSHCPQRPARLRAQLRQSSKSALLPPKPAACTRRSQRASAGLARYAVYKARGGATEDARPTIASLMRCAGRPRCRPCQSRRSRSRW